MKLKNVADIYPLSPMQETMLFHAVTRLHGTPLLNVKNSDDTLFNQVHFTVNGPLDVQRLQNSWQQVLQLNASLRTGFVYEGLKQPQQIVRQNLTSPFNYHDLSDLSETEQEEALAAILSKDRALGFDPQKPPLMRVNLLCFRNDFYHLIWSSHHLIFDRWCIPTVFEQLANAYDNDGQLAAGTTTAQYKRYIAWLKNQNLQKTNDFWKKRLAGFTHPSKLTSTSSAQNIQDIEGHYQRSLPSDTYKAMRAFCQQHTLTMATLMQGAWCLVLHEHTQQQDVVYGVVVSGRPSEVPNIEQIVGSFVNNLPMRSILDGSHAVVAWLKSIQRDSIRQTQYDYIALSELHQHTNLNENDGLFDTILLWLSPSKTQAVDNVEWHAVSADSHTAFPYTLTIEERDHTLQLTGDLAQNSKLIVSHATLFDRLEYILAKLVSVEHDSKLIELGIAEQNSNGRSRSTKAEAETPGGESLTGSGREKTQSEALQEYLRYEWKQLLAVESVSLDDDFFDLGGNSLKAAQLLKRIEMIEHKSIPLLSLFQGRTIRGMADIIVNQNWPVNTQIAMQVKKQGTHEPLFCIASPEVNTIGYANLAHYLDVDRPIYVLQGAPLNDKVSELHADQIPALAKAYLTAMQEVQPQGPYHLLGMCTGAQIAIEMARELEAHNQSLGFLSIVNTWAFYTVTSWYRLQKLRNRLTYYKNRIAGKTLAQLRSELVQKRLRAKQASVDVDPAHTNQAGAQISSVVPTDEDQHEDYYSIIDDVGWTHLLPQFTKVKQTMTVFRLKKQPYWRLNDRALGWHNQCEKTAVIELEGTNHMSIMREPYVNQLAKELTNCLTTQK